MARSPRALADAALDTWRFAKSRAPGQSKIDARSIGSNRGVVQLLNDDRRFLVDSVSAALSGFGLEIDLVELLHYFPPQLRDLAPDTLVTHRLRREIVATIAANVLVNRMGPSFIEETQARTGRDPAAIAAA